MEPVGAYCISDDLELFIDIFVKYYLTRVTFHATSDSDFVYIDILYILLGTKRSIYKRTFVLTHICILSTL